MTDTTVPKSVDSVVNQLQHHDIHGAVDQINKELTSHNGQPERNKEFLSTLTKECQQKGLLPQLAVDFGKEHFKDLDLNNDGYINKQELDHVLRDPQMKASLNPFEKEMSAYLLANMDAIKKATGDTYGIRPQTLDAYESQSGTKYDAYQHGQDVLKTFGTKEKFKTLDTDKDGFISKDEIGSQLDFNTRALSIPGLVTPEATKNLEEQNRALQFMKDHQKEIASSVADTTFSNSISLADIQKYAELNANPRTSEKTPTIDENIVGKPTSEGGVSLERGNKMSEVLMKYGIDHRWQLDLDGNGSISKAELSKVLDSPTWKNSMSADERKVLETMRSRFDQLATTNSNGDYGITPNSLVDYNRSEDKARDNETKSASAARFIKENFNGIDTDHNGWISADELHKTQEFYARALSSGLVQPSQQAKVAEDLKDLDYLDQHRSEISSATFSSDMTKADIEKYAAKHSGHLTDVFQPTNPKPNPDQQKPVVETKPNPEQQKPATPEPNPENSKPWLKPIPTPEPGPNAEQKPVLKPIPNPEPGPTADHKPVLKPIPENPDFECEDGVCRPKKHDKPSPVVGPVDTPVAPVKTKPDQTPVLGPLDTPVAPVKTKPDQTPVLEKEAAEKAAKQKLEKPAPEKDEFDQYIDKYYKYTDKNYGQALKDAYDSGKPVVLVMGSQKTPEAVQAGAQANLDGKAVVVYLDVNKVDPNSQLGEYATQLLEQHNRQSGTSDQAVTTVFSVGGKNESGSFTPKVPTHTDWGRLNDYSSLLRRQIAETASYGNTVRGYQQYYYQNCPSQCH